jgi:hypothetical protein
MQAPQIIKPSNDASLISCPRGAQKRDLDFQCPKSNHSQVLSLRMFCRFMAHEKSTPRFAPELLPTSEQGLLPLFKIDWGHYYATFTSTASLPTYPSCGNLVMTTQYRSLESVVQRQNNSRFLLSGRRSSRAVARRRIEAKVVKMDRLNKSDGS